MLDAIFSLIKQLEDFVVLGLLFLALGGWVLIAFLFVAGSGLFSRKGGK